MKIDIDTIKRIIKEELSSAGTQDKKPEQKKQDMKFSDANAQKLANASKKNVQAQKAASAASEKGGSALVQSILAELMKFKNNGSSKEDIIAALKLVIPKIPKD
jgi:hypothetical protein